MLPYSGDHDGREGASAGGSGGRGRRYAWGGMALVAGRGSAWPRGAGAGRRWGGAGVGKRRCWGRNGERWHERVRERRGKRKKMGWRLIPSSTLISVAPS
jgi:hypothetical protein